MSPCGRYIAVGAADAEKTIQIIDLDIMGVYTKIRYAHSSNSDWTLPLIMNLLITK